MQKICRAITAKIPAVSKEIGFYTGLISLIFVLVTMTGNLADHERAAAANFLPYEVEKEISQEDVKRAVEIHEHLQGGADFYIFGLTSGDGGLDADEIEKREGPPPSAKTGNLAFVELGERTKIHILSFDEPLDLEKAGKLASATDGGNDADYIKAKLHPFVDFIDIYGEIEIETELGTKELNSSEAGEYLLDGGEWANHFSHPQRQKQVMMSMLERVEETEEEPDFISLGVVFLGAIDRIETTFGFRDGMRAGYEFVSSISEKGVFYCFEESEQAEQHSFLHLVD